MDMMQARALRIAVVGLGLIGGSFARALKKYTTHCIGGCDIDLHTVSAASEAGAIDAIIADDDFSAYDLVLFALYPQQTVAFIKTHISRFQKGALLVDTCGVKEYPVRELTGFCAAHGLTFIGGHPMAGREKWGFDSSQADLFQGASMILTPTDQAPQNTIQLLKDLFLKIGFGSVKITTPQAHDKMIAFTSQLAHIVSSAYVKSPAAQEHHGFSAGSYKDLTRVAKLNARMWTELFLENDNALLTEIDTIITHLQEYRQAIAQRQGDRLFELLEDGRKRKEALD